jgi:anti-sigma factor (TIGR02949 family)
MISCAEAVRQLWEYLDNELPADAQEKVDTHLAFCRRCCGELEFAQELQLFLRSKKATELPIEVHERLEQFIDSLDPKETS